MFDKERKRFDGIQGIIQSGVRNFDVREVDFAGASIAITRAASHPIEP